MVLCMTACSQTLLSSLTEGVTIQNVRMDFATRIQQFDRAADLLLEHHQFFLDQEPGRVSGSVYRLADPDWSTIQNGYAWTPDEWETLQSVLKTKGLIYVGYAPYLYPEVYFIFYIPNSNSDYCLYTLRKCASEESDSLQCAYAQVQYIIANDTSSHSCEIELYDILANAGWYASWWYKVK